MDLEDDGRDAFVRLGGARTAIITLNRPAVRNAMGWRMWDELDECLVWATGNDDVGAVVLTGAGSCFSAGGDLGDMGEGVGVLGPGARLRRAHEVLFRLHASTTPTIAAVESYAIGVAWGLVLACDVVVTGRSAYFHAPFTSYGLVPDGGVVWQLTRRLGIGAAARYLHLGRRLEAEDAAAGSLVEDVVDDGRALVRAVELAGELATRAPAAMALTKHLVALAASTGYVDFLAAEATAATLALHGLEGAAYTHRPDEVATT